MRWLGTNSGNQLDAVENVEKYAEAIKETQSTLFALQEIGATHSVAEQPKCYYLDLIIEKLNESISDSSGHWDYILDSRNKNQRLAFLYKNDMWTIESYRSIRPGSSFNYIRRPFLAVIKAKGNNANLTFTYINIHLKAFPDTASREKRGQNLEELADWLDGRDLDEDVLIAGDTNIYFGKPDLDKPLEDIDYTSLYDAERTAMYEGRLSQRFDRFYCSPGMLPEITSAKNRVGKKDFIDVIKEEEPDALIAFEENLSDHFPVILHIDVSQEK